MINLLIIVRSIRDELYYLYETPSNVGEVVKMLGNHKCLVKVWNLF